MNTSNITRNIHDYLRVTKVLESRSGLQHTPEHILNNACIRGQIIHDICDAIIYEIGVPFIEPEYLGYVESFKKWVLGKRFIDKPPRLFCDKYMITGELDQILKNDDELVIIDFKTPEKESKTWPLQGSAYAYLCRVNGYNISRIQFIKLSKKGNDAIVFEYKENFQMFLECLYEYREREFFLSL